MIMIKENEVPGRIQRTMQVPYTQTSHPMYISLYVLEYAHATSPLHHQPDCIQVDESVSSKSDGSGVHSNQTVYDPALVLFTHRRHV